MNISYVLLLHNEPQGKTLVNYLLNAKDEGDEIIILDDGCADTFPIKTIKHTLGHSYSEHRNIALEHCSGDYVLWLDADEMLAPYLQGNIKRILTKLKPDLVWLPRLNVIGGKEGLSWPDWQGRIVRRDSGLRWFGNLHEQIKAGSETNQLILSPDKDYSIIHTKTLEKQNADNARYVAGWTEAENRGVKHG